MITLFWNSTKTRHFLRNAKDQICNERAEGGRGWGSLGALGSLNRVKRSTIHGFINNQ